MPEPDGYLVIETINRQFDPNDSNSQSASFNPTDTARYDFRYIRWWAIHFRCIVIAREEGRSYIPLENVVSFDVNYNSEEVQKAWRKELEESRQVSDVSLATFERTGGHQ